MKFRPVSREARLSFFRLLAITYDGDKLRAAVQHRRGCVAPDVLLWGLKELKGGRGSDCEDSAASVHLNEPRNRLDFFHFAWFWYLTR